MDVRGFSVGPPVSKRRRCDQKSFRGVKARLAVRPFRRHRRFDAQHFEPPKRAADFAQINVKLHRVIEWVDFSPIFGSPVAVVVIAVGMWATRLRCPSCPQRFPLVWT